MSYAAPAVITIKARHGRDAWRGPRVQAVQVRGLGQSDDAPIPSGSTLTFDDVDRLSARPSVGGKGGPVAAVVPGAKTPAGAPVSTTPYVPTTTVMVATQSSPSWMPWLIGGAAIVGVLGIGYAVSR